MGKKLYVGNLPFSATDDSLQEMFAQSGSVTSAKIIMDRDTGRSKGFGFVEMASDQEAADAIQKLNGQSVGGRAITVAEARPVTPREDRGGGEEAAAGMDQNRGICHCSIVICHLSFGKESSVPFRSDDK